MNYELLVGEPWDFEGPDGKNKILVSSVGVIHVTDNKNYDEESYLLKVIHPFIMDKQRVEFLVFQPRHTGNTIQQIASIGGVVGI
jgi:hypothetical protein